MKCPMVVRVVLLAALPLALGACQVTPEFVRAALCEPVPEPVVVEPVPEVSEPSSW